MASSRPDEQSGDYGYDLVHEPGVMSAGQADDHATPHGAGPPPRKDPDGDYGYDEAHDG
jgi:hypothetical protein